MTSRDSPTQNQQGTKFLKTQFHSLTRLTFTATLWDREVSNILIIFFFFQMKKLSFLHNLQDDPKATGWHTVGQVSLTTQ